MGTNLKIIGVALFAFTFLMGGFFIKTTNVEAAGTTPSFSVSYSLSSVVISPNGDGSTVVMIGCAPSSGDIYDINTGLRCMYITTKVMIGCAPSSGDKYDINTGKQCTNYIAPTLIGCAPGSGDIYDTNTGKLCTVDTSIISSATNKNANIVQTTPKVTQKSVIGGESPLASASITSGLVETSPTENSENQLSDKDKIMNDLTSSVGKISTVMTGPMSIWIILFIIIIILGGGYGVYSFINNDEKKVLETKKEVTKPITPLVKTPITQTPPVSTTPNNSQASFLQK